MGTRMNKLEYQLKKLQNREHQLKQYLTQAIHERNWQKADTYKIKIDETRNKIEKILKTINGEI